MAGDLGFRSLENLPFNVLQMLRALNLRRLTPSLALALVLGGCVSQPEPAPANSASQARPINDEAKINARANILLQSGEAATLAEARIRAAAELAHAQSKSGNP